MNPTDPFRLDIDIEFSHYGQHIISPGEIYITRYDRVIDGVNFPLFVQITPNTQHLLPESVSEFHLTEEEMRKCVLDLKTVLDKFDKKEPNYSEITKAAIHDL